MMLRDPIANDVRDRDHGFLWLGQGLEIWSGWIGGFHRLGLSNCSEYKYKYKLLEIQIQIARNTNKGLEIWSGWIGGFHRLELSNQRIGRSWAAVEKTWKLVGPGVHSQVPQLTRGSENQTRPGEAEKDRKEQLHLWPRQSSEHTSVTSFQHKTSRK